MLNIYIVRNFSKALQKDTDYLFKEFLSQVYADIRRSDII